MAKTKPRREPRAWLVLPSGKRIELTPHKRDAGLLTSLQEFAEQKLSTEKEIRRAQFGAWQFSWNRSGTRSQDDDPGTATPDAEMLRDLQKQLRRLFDRLRSKKPGLFWFTEAPIQFGLRVDGAARRYAIANSTTAIAGPFFSAVSELLGRIQGELRECDAPECTRLYAPHRPQQRYCSRTCQNRATMTRFLKKPAASAARHERHMQAQEKKLGVKLKRRKPR